MQSTSLRFSKRNGLSFAAGLFSFAVCFCFAGWAVTVEDPNPVHPLDALTKDEVATTVEILKTTGKVSERSRFPIIVLNEPPKEEALSFEPGRPVKREAFAVVYERPSNQTFEAIVDVKNKYLLSWKEIPGVQPSFLKEDDKLTEKIVRADPQWQAAMRKRGITDFERVDVETYPGGYYGLPGEEGIRIRRAFCFYKGKTENAYAPPIEGVVAYVDLNKLKVFKLIDTGAVPLPKSSVGFNLDSIGKLREAPKPLRIVQPQGASFEVTGNQVRWQHWHFRFAMHPREGLVLYTVAYEDHGKLRPVLYRASLSEMVVPYGDPGPTWFFRNAFDEGEDTMGRYMNSLEPLIDSPGNAQFFNAVFADEKGVPFEIPRAAALYERDGGLLWMHFEHDHNESRRARQLVLSWIATVGNYTYGFNWVFHQDGALEMEVLLTGVMEVKAVNATKVSEESHDEMYGHLVGENLAAVHHQHFFNFRLDMDVDGGPGNSVVELNTEALAPGPDNPFQNGFMAKETLLRTEQEGQRQLSDASSRKWKIINPSVKNALGEPVGYMLLPGENSIPYAAPDSWLRKRAGFVNAHLWVTPYDPKQIYAGGFYIAQSRGDDGLSRWVEANRSIANRDVVVWYTVGVTHIPRPEEWPVMPVHRIGFKLVPCGFFSQNPALDVPKPE